MHINSDTISINSATPCLNNSCSNNSCSNNCSICLTNMDDNLHVLTCKHTFHKECINNWIKKSTTCPICRSIITRYKIEYRTEDRRKYRTKYIFWMSFFCISVMFFIGSSIYNVYEFYTINSRIDNYLKTLNTTELGEHEDKTNNANMLIGVDVIYFVVYFCVNFVILFGNNNNNIYTSNATIGVCYFFMAPIIFMNGATHSDFYKNTMSYLLEKNFNFDNSYYDNLGLSLILYGNSFAIKLITNCLAHIYHFKRYNLVSNYRLMNENEENEDDEEDDENEDNEEDEDDEENEA